MRHCIDNFESGKDSNRDQCLPVTLNKRQFPANEDCGSDQQDGSAQDIANNCQGMCPLAGRGNPSDFGLDDKVNIYR